jgi:hypothetical protein
MTVLELIKSSFRLLNINAVGDSLNTAEANEAMAVLNMMIDNWSTQSFNLYKIVTNSSGYTISANTASYTIGTGQTWSADRPVKITSMYVKDSDTATVSYKLSPITNDRYQDLVLKGIATTYPTHFLYTPTFPYGTITLYPVPSGALKAFVSQWQTLTAFTALTDSVAFPPGYEMAIRYGLAELLIPQYGSPQSVVAHVREYSQRYLNDIKVINYEPKYMQPDPALSGNGGRFNIYSGW